MSPGAEITGLTALRYRSRTQPMSHPRLSSTNNKNNQITYFTKKNMTPMADQPRFRVKNPKAIDFSLGDSHPGFAGARILHKR